ncbi:Phosphoribosylamine-glycine ligase PurD [Methanonatronarchaeum thermophilum]|uniref:Phosphoribosylamine-glycine ligase PurD n=1 Tax=Methanonatronarchaeum thermophilum TaxID=1927129 RepID=A0A1Y3GFE6_9EURY|nr:hypothetical protein [Methanonatronarchaeum thermophilum]OUJ18185.1 Phosphoribosylamine-glycine ligase PurD [Methanonatronarchaeum thermophilum]
MKEVGILIVSYGSRAASMVDAFSRSDKYDVTFYIADKQNNPYNLKMAKISEGDHEVTGLDVNRIFGFARKYRDEIDFGIVGPEGPIIDGVRDRIENELCIPIICPTSKYALEGSKVRQREIIDKVHPSANPEYKVFSKDQYQTEKEAIEDLNKWIEQNGIEVAVKPDTPAAGKGVGVWGDHFTTKKELIEDWFLPNLKGGKVILEEKVDGEEWSLQFISDGTHLIPTPPVRDYKRAYDRDLGPNTGGMGTYTYKKTQLPFMDPEDWEEGIEIAKKIFIELKKNTRPENLRGVPLYMGYVSCKDGVKAFEINSRFGDPECQNTMALIKDDFVDVCLKMIEGELDEIKFKDKCTVLTYAVPMTYGNARKEYTGTKKINLQNAHRLKEKYGENLRIHQGSMIEENGVTKTGTSRTVSTVGIADTIQEAREISLEAIRRIDGALWNRWDIASKEHIQESKQNMKEIRK